MDPSETNPPFNPENSDSDSSQASLPISNNPPDRVGYARDSASASNAFAMHQSVVSGAPSNNNTDAAGDIAGMSTQDLHDEAPVSPPVTPVPAITPTDVQPIPPVTDIMAATPATPATPPHGMVTPSQGLIGQPTQPFTAASPLQPAKKHSSLLKLLVIIVGVVVVLGGGAAAFYYGYYMNASVVWSQAMGNANQGYSTLVKSLSNESSTHYKSERMMGTFSYQEGTSHIDGTLASQSSGESSTSTITVNTPLTKITSKAITVPAQGSAEPDVYLQLNGITGLGDVFGSQFGKEVNSLNGKWIAINHTFLEDLDSDLKQQGQPTSTPSQAEVVAAAQAIGAVNAKYLFTTNKQYAVTTVEKNLGSTTVDGQKMYEYQVGFVKANVKAYITALKNTVQQSSVGKWLVSYTGTSVSNLMDYTKLESDANKLTGSDTADVWVNLKDRVPYQVKVPYHSNPAENYTTFGLNYTGGDTYPFFVNLTENNNGSTTHGTLDVTWNSKTDATVLTVGMTGSLSGTAEAFSMNLNLTPSNQTVNVTAPKGAESLSSVLNTLGLGSFFDELNSGDGNSSTPTTSLGSLGSSL